MDLINLESWGEKMDCIVAECHSLVAESMRETTLASSKACAMGEEPKGKNFEGSHGSVQIRIEVPSPTFHLMPSLSTSLPFKILRHT